MILTERIRQWLTAAFDEGAVVSNAGLLSLAQPDRQYGNRAEAAPWLFKVSAVVAATHSRNWFHVASHWLGRALRIAATEAKVRAAAP